LICELTLLLTYTQKQGEIMQLTKKAQKVLDLVESGTDVNEIPEAEKWSCGDGFEYGLWDGGYIKLESILEGEDLKRAQEASKVLEEVRDLWQKISMEI
jgi:hypothetical protein